jgi:hypothetical protein
VSNQKAHSEHPLASLARWPLLSLRSRGTIAPLQATGGPARHELASAAAGAVTIAD